MVKKTAAEPAIRHVINNISKTLSKYLSYVNFQSICRFITNEKREPNLFTKF